MFAARRWIAHSIQEPNRTRKSERIRSACAADHLQLRRWRGAAAGRRTGSRSTAPRGCPSPTSSIRLLRWRRGMRRGRGRGLVGVPATPPSASAAHGGARGGAGGRSGVPNALVVAALDTSAGAAAAAALSPDPVSDPVSSSPPDFHADLDLVPC